MKTAVIVQARMGSKRFPGKVLADLCGHPVLWHVLTRAGEIPADHHVLASPDEELERLARDCRFDFFRGLDNEDVLTRYVQAATWLALENGDAVVRITGDCPMLSIVECKRVLREFQEGTWWYHSNVWPRAVPSGLDCEVFSVAALRHAHQYATSEYDREHVTPFLREAKYSIDTPEDLARVSAMMQAA